MKIMMMQVFTALVLVVSVTLGAPFDPAGVSQDATWVLHIDAEALRTSVIGQALLEQELDAGALAQLEQAKETFGMDPREDLKALTIYGSGIDQDDAVVLIRGNVNREKLLAQVSALDGYRQMRHGARDVHSWMDVAAGETARYYGVLLDDAAGVLSKSLDHLQKALAVLDGEQQNIAQGGIDTAVLSSRGVMVAATADFSNVDLSGNPMFANANARTFRMQLREADENLGLRVAAQQASEQDAAQTLNMLNGFKMMGVMQLQQENPDLAGLLQAITIERNDNMLLLRLTYPAAKIVELVKSAAQQAGGIQ